MSTAQEQFVGILSLSARHAGEALGLTQNAAIKLSAAAGEASSATRTDLAARAGTAAEELKRLNGRLAQLQAELQTAAGTAATVGRRAA